MARGDYTLVDSAQCSLNPGLIVAEQTGLDNDAYTGGGMKLLVVQKPLAITVIILQEQILIVALEQTVAEFNGGVIIQLPASTFGQYH